MNAQEAQRILAAAEDLQSLIAKKAPKTKEVKDEYNGDYDTYDFLRVELLNHQIVYRRYMGCGEYEYAYSGINFNELFKD